MTSDTPYDRPIQIAEGIFWVGYRDVQTNLSCNPYLVVQGDQAVLIDGGSRTDFAVVMMKILQTGIDPQKVTALVYQHYDPDLCGSMANFIDMCDNPELKIISEKTNNVFISYYIPRDKYHLLQAIDQQAYAFAFNQRTLHFIPTPYAHSPGSFATYDSATKTLFSSDLFGSYSTQWDLLLQLEPTCFVCQDYDDCPNRRSACPVKDMLVFHQQIMPCTKALRHALSKISGQDLARIAPQHGSIISGPTDIGFVIGKLAAMDKVGIDAIV